MASERTNDERASVIAGAAAASFGSREDADEYVYAVALRMIDEAVDAEIARLRAIIEADGLDPDAPMPPGLTVVNERLRRELEESRRERSAARAEALTAQASLRRVERELEEARERERALREALVEVAIPLEAFWMVMHDSDLLSAEGREAVQKALGIVRRTVGATTVSEGGE